MEDVVRIVSDEEPLVPGLRETVVELNEVVTVRLEGDVDADRVMLPVRPRLLRVIVALD